MKIHSIRLELVRTGEAENQLLSPLTPYLALCEDRPAEEVHVPFVHGEFLELHHKMRYGEGFAAATEAATKMTLLLHQFLNSIKCLGQEVASAQNADVIEVRLVLSAAELAILPFELVSAANLLPASRTSFPKPTIILRQSRRHAQKLSGWPDCPKILLVSSEAGGAVPAKSHLLALQNAIKPFLPYPVDQYDSSSAAWLGGHIDVITNASLLDIRLRCGEQNYSHVHILAHGGEEGPSWARRFGLMLSAAGGQGVELVRGGQLASALRSPSGEYPTVVTLASCDSGNQGNVIVPGGSLAQELHGVGIPLVAASQFPLTFQGSVAMVEEFYKLILQGRDPREVVLETRASMIAMSPPQSLDWASLVVYAAPSDVFSWQVKLARRRVLKRQIDAKIAQLGSGIDMKGNVPRHFETPAQLETYRRELRQLQDSWLDVCSGEHMAEGQLFFASSEKRWAESVVNLPEHLWNQGEVINVLRNSRDAYREASIRLVERGAEILVHSLVLDVWVASLLRNCTEKTELFGVMAEAVSHLRWLLEQTPWHEREDGWFRMMLELDVLSPANAQNGSWMNEQLLRGLVEHPDGGWEPYSLLRQLALRYQVFVSEPGIKSRAEQLAKALQERGVPLEWEPVVMWKPVTGRRPR